VSFLDDLGGFGGLTQGIGSLASAAGSIAGAFQDAPKTANNAKPFLGPAVTPAYVLGGGVLTNRDDRFGNGTLAISNRLAQLQNTIAPGYSDYRNAGINAIRQKAAEAAGNLRAQLGRRGLAGASFAEDTAARVAQEYQQAEDQFRSQAFQDELAANLSAVDRAYNVLSLGAQKDLQELGLSLDYLGHVNQVALSQKGVVAALAQQQLAQQLTRAIISDRHPRQQRLIWRHNRQSGNCRWGNLNWNRWSNTSRAQAEDNSERHKVGRQCAG